MVLLKEITGLLLKSGSVEEFCKQPPKIARDWLERNSPDGAQRLRQFLTQHGHRGIKEVSDVLRLYQVLQHGHRGIKEVLQQHGHRGIKEVSDVLRLYQVLQQHGHRGIKEVSDVLRLYQVLQHGHCGIKEVCDVMRLYQVLQQHGHRGIKEVSDVLRLYQVLQHGHCGIKEVCDVMRLYQVLQQHGHCGIKEVSDVLRLYQVLQHGHCGIKEVCDVMRLYQVLQQHGHCGIKEFDLMTETWELDCSSLISMIQTMLRSSTSTNHSKRETFTSKQTVDRLRSPRKLGTKLALRWLLPVCRTSVARRENTKESFIKVIHKFRLAYRGLARLLVKEEVLPDESLVFFLTHYELGKVLDTHDPVLVTKAARRQRLWPQWERLKFPEISIGLPAPVKGLFLHKFPTAVNTVQDISGRRERFVLRVSSLVSNAVEGAADAMDCTPLNIKINSNARPNPTHS
uniref:Uncharacterized protein n=1 Tax=Timema bartmani TaxID=61472 RepID=A0A7R9FAJ9_9NEOP|nr:unnamed protein product [Timema bartmani]